MADVVLARRQILLLKAESTYGTDSVPTEGNSFEALRLVDEFTTDFGQENVQVSGGNLTRGFNRPIPTTKPAGVTFRTYVVGISGNSYTASIKPPLADALRGCGLQETYLTAGNGSYQYDPTLDVSSDISVTIVAHQDGFEHRLLGCRGNVNFIHVAGRPVVAEFTYRGILSTEATTTRNAPTGLPTQQPPRWIGSGTIFVESVQVNVENMNLATGNTVYEEPSANATSGSGIANVLITDRRPAGSMDPESNPTSLNAFAQWRATSGVVLRSQAGVTNGNIFTIVASQIVFDKVAWGNKQGMNIFNINYEATERNANDNFRITFS